MNHFPGVRKLIWLCLLLVSGVAQAAERPLIVREADGFGTRDAEAMTVDDSGTTLTLPGLLARDVRTTGTALLPFTRSTTVTTEQLVIYNSTTGHVWTAIDDQGNGEWAAPTGGGGASFDTEAELEALLTDVTDVFTNNDGALADDDLSDDAIDALSDVVITAAATGEYLRFNGTNWVDDTIQDADLPASIARDIELHDAFTLNADTEALFTMLGQQMILDNQAANTVFAGPTTGADADPTFRALVADDIPDLSATYLTLAAIDTEAELEAIWSANIIIETEIDSEAELEAIVGVDFLTDTEGDAAYQPLDADLTALAAQSGFGFIVRNGANSYVHRSLGQGTGISISDNGGIAAAPVIGVTSAVTLDAEWDTEGEMETAWGGVNILLETEIDTEAEFEALLFAILTPGEAVTSESDPVFSAVDTEAELESHLTDVSNVFTNNDGALDDDDLTDNDLDDLSDVDAAAPSDGDVLTWVAANSAWEAAAASGGGGSGTLADVATASDDQTKSTYTAFSSTSAPLFEAFADSGYSLWITNADTSVGNNQSYGRMAFYSADTAASGGTSTTPLGAVVEALGTATHTSTNRASKIRLSTAYSTNAPATVMDFYRQSDAKPALQWPTDADGLILGGSTTTAWSMHGGNNSTSGGGMALYATSHASRPGTLDLLSDSTIMATVNSTGLVVPAASALTLTGRSAPGSPTSGMVYFDSGDSHFYGYTGSGWAALDGAGGALDDLSDVVITAAATNEVLSFNGTNWVDAALTTAHLPSGATLDAEWDTEAEVETIWGTGIVNTTEFNTLGDARFLKLDASNDPLTGELNIQVAHAANAFRFDNTNTNWGAFQTGTYRTNSTNRAADRWGWSASNNPFTGYANGTNYRVIGADNISFADTALSSEFGRMTSSYLRMSGLIDWGGYAGTTSGTAEPSGGRLSGTTQDIHRSGAAIDNGTGIGAINFRGSESGGGAANEIGAAIKAFGDTTWSANDSPGRLQFYTTPDGTDTEQARMTINNAGNVGIGDTNPTEALLTLRPAAGSGSHTVLYAANPDASATDAAAWYMLHSDSGDLQFYDATDAVTVFEIDPDADATRLRLTSSGVQSLGEIQGDKLHMAFGRNGTATHPAGGLTTLYPIGLLGGGYITTRAGSIVGMSNVTNVNTGSGTGTATLNILVDGSIVWSETLSTGTGDVKNQFTQARGTDTFAAGAKITMTISTSGTLSFEYYHITSLAEIVYD